MIAIVLPALLGPIACVGEEVTAETPTPWILPEDEVPVFELEVAAVELAVAEVMAQILSLSGLPAYETYLSIMTDGDSACPYIYPIEEGVYAGVEQDYWAQECTANSGASFSGYGYSIAYDRYTPGDGNRYIGGGVSSQARITTADGNVFVGAGTAVAYRAEALDGSVAIYVAETTGMFSFDGPGGGWLSSGMLPALSFEGYAVPNGGPVGLIVDGGVEGLEGDIDIVVFEELMLLAEGYGSSCPIEPSGAMSVRNTAGEWVDIRFDGPTGLEAPSDPETCDGCGGAYHEGEYIGELCLDVSALLDWPAEGLW